MVKRLVMLFMCLVLIFPLVSSVDFQMKENITRGETIMAKISGNFLDAPVSSSIFLYRKNGQVQVPMEFKIKELGGEYYLYGQTFKEGNPLVEDNYSIVIKNVRYLRILGEITTDNIIKNFTVNSDIADFFIDPGFIETKDNFSITVKNLQDKKINIEVIAGKVTQAEGNSSGGLWERLFGGTSEKESNEESVEQLVSLIPGEEKEIKINSFASNKDVMKNLALQTENTLYSIPVYVLGSSVEEKPVVIFEKEKFYFDEDKIEEFLLTNETLEKKVNLVNNVGLDISNITLDYTYSVEGILNLTPKNISFIRNNDSKEMTIKLGLSKEELSSIMNSSSNNKNYYGFIRAKAGENLSTKVELNITFFKTNVSLPTVKNKTCSEAGGKVCNETTKCEGELKYFVENKEPVNCCVGICKNSASSPVWKFLGWIILVCVIIFLVWFFLKKYRGAKNEVNLIKAATGKK